MSLRSTLGRWRRRVVGRAKRPSPELVRARELAKARDWPAAAEAYEVVVAQGGSLTSRYRLGDIYTRLGRIDDARRTIGDALAEDPTRRPIDDRVLARRPKRFLKRRSSVHFVQDNLDAIRAASAPDIRAAAGAPLGQPWIFLYWSQGIENAPSVVRMCRDQLVALHGDRVVVLDDASLPDWVDIPAAVVKNARPTLTQYSDVVRSALLAEHGGYWVDATCLVTGDLVAMYPELTRAGFWALSYGDHQPASWFLASRRGGVIMTMLRDAQYLYWEQNKRPIGYFMFHQLFEGLLLLDEDFAREWEGTAGRRIEPDRALQRAMSEPYDADRLDELLAVAFAHKLTYKRHGTVVQPGSMLAHLVDHGVPVRASGSPGE